MKNLSFIFLFLPFFCLSQTHKYYFDAINGNDANTSVQAQTQAGAWKTITKLNSFFSSLVAGDSVLFRRGQTFSGNIIPNKSGTSLANINLGAWDVGALPVISGFTSVPSWTNLGGNKWSAVVASAQTTLNMLTVNGAFQAIGRFPKANSATTSWTNGGYYQYQTFSGTTSITSNQIAASANFVGGEVVIRGNHFDIDRGTITSQTSTTVNYTMSTAPIAVTPLLANFGFFFQNHPNALTAQGDWCYIPSTKTVEIFSTTTPTNINVSVLQNNVLISGQSFLSFNNISFQGANTAAVSMNNCNHISFNNCDVSLQGTNGIVTTNSSSHDITVNRCTLSYINNNGIDANTSTLWNISGNTFNNMATISGMGLTGDGQYQATSYIGSTSTITLNSFFRCGFNPIMYRGDGVTVTNNFVNDFCFIKDDGGGIYSYQTTGAAPKLVQSNIVINGIGAPDGTNGLSGGGAVGIYFDGQSTNTNCLNNSVGLVQQIGILFNNPVGATISGNTVYNAGQVGFGGQMQINENAGSQNVRSIINTKNIYVANNTGQDCGLWYSPTNLDVNLWWTRTDSNYYARPVAQNTVIFKREASPVHFTLPQWQTFINQDLHSKGSPKVIPDTTTNNILFVYNATSSPTATTLPGTWIDMNGTNYVGSITLQPFTSAVLLFSSNIGVPLTVTGTVAQNPVTCFGQTTSITANATGGTPPYKFKLNSGSFSSVNVFPNLGAGTYTLSVQDAILATTSTNVTIVQPPQISISQVSGTITINGNTTTTTVTASGGTGTLQYQLDGGTFQPSNVFTGVGAGVHTITVRDANLCTNTLTYTLTQPSVLALALVATTNPLLCFGNTTTLTANASGGTTPYSYQLNSGTPQSSNTFIVGANVWSVTVTDFAGAVTTQIATITQPSQIFISESHTNIVINGGNTTVTITANGGSGAKTYSLDGSTPQSSNIFTNVLAGNHTIVVRDANGCSNSLAFTITQPFSLNVSATITTAITCNGGTNGAITGSASGGTTPYDYQLNGGTRQVNPLFSNLSPATYTLTVHDGGGAIVSASPLTLNQPSQITISLAYGSAPTTLTITAGGGAGGFTYSLDGSGFQPSNTFSNVLSGNHTATVKDANGCTTSQLFSVGSSLTLTLSAGTIACNNGVTSATVIPSGGTFPYRYLWSDGQVQSTANNLVAGTYTVTVTDNQNHSHDTTFVIANPPAITISIVTGTININGGTTTATVTAGGGAGSFQYSLDGGSYQGSNSFAGIPAGNHFITVKDANNCTQIQNFTLSQPGALIISISRGAAIACNGGTQAITVGATGGTTPYTGTGTFNKLAGTYTFTITDAFGAVADTIITVTQPAAIAISVSTGTIIVNGGTTTVTATASGGSGSLQYKLDGGSYQGTGNFTGVSAGLHSVTVKDANNCTNVNNFSISQPTPLTMTATPTTNPFNCYGDVTTVTIAGNGGTLPYQYGMNGVFGGTATFTNLSAATYTFSVKDAFGAQHDTIITLSQPPLISIIQITQFPSIIGAYGGTADSVIVQNAGGVPIGGTVYQYSLDGGGYTQSDSAFKFKFTNVSGGNHTVSIKDAHGCIQTYSFIVIQPAAPLQGIIKRQPARHKYYQL